MKTTPMLFNGDMVRALIDGRKTQTRLICKLPRNYAQIDFMGGRGDWNDPSAWGFEHPDTGHWALKGDGDIKEIPCPYGQPGDLIWCRETFIAGKGVGGYQPHVDPDKNPDGPTIDVIYRGDDGPAEQTAGPWQPSIHMPRWASRLTLRITDVRVERVQEISTDNVCDEGLDFELGQVGDWFNEGEHLHIAGAPLNGERFAFARLWDSIYADRGHGWDANPWVWAITFEVIHANVDDVLAAEVA